MILEEMLLFPEAITIIEMMSDVEWVGDLCKASALTGITSRVYIQISYPGREPAFGIRGLVGHYLSLLYPARSSMK